MTSAIQHIQSFFKMLFNVICLCSLGLLTKIASGYDLGKTQDAKDVDIESYPYMMRLTITVESSFLHLGITKHCGATLIGPQCAITAAHCVNRKRHETIRIEGTYGCSEFGKSECKKVMISNVEIHPYYKAKHLIQRTTNDIAVLRLAEPVSIEKYATLPTSPPNDTSEAVILGWGFLENGIKSDHLKSVSMPDAVQCPFYSFSPTKFCAGFIDGNACPDETGGPLVIDGVLYGIADKLENCGFLRDRNYFTNVTQFIDFIDDHKCTV